MGGGGVGVLNFLSDCAYGGCSFTRVHRLDRLVGKAGTVWEFLQDLVRLAFCKVAGCGLCCSFLLGLRGGVKESTCFAFRGGVLICLEVSWVTYGFGREGVV